MADFVQRFAVNSDYSQIYVRFADVPPDIQDGWMPVYVALAEHGTGLAHFSMPGQIMVIVCRQFGNFDIDVAVLEARPADDEDGEDVVELSFAATGDVRLSGWEESPDDPQLPLDPGVEYRLRYSVWGADATRARPEPPYPERYELKFWPEPATTAAVIRRSSEWARYWVINREIEIAVDELMWLTPRDELSEQQRVDRIAMSIFTRFPDVADDIRAGRGHWAKSMGTGRILGYVAGEEEPPWAAPETNERLVAEIQRIAQAWRGRA